MISAVILHNEIPRLVHVCIQCYEGVGKKLSFRRVVLALEGLYRVPEGRIVNRWWPGREESFMMLLALSR